MMTLIALILLATLYFLLYILIVHPEKVISILQNGIQKPSSPKAENTSETPLPIVVKSYNLCNEAKRSEIETRKIEEKSEESTFVPESKDEFPAQLPNEDLDRVFDEGIALEEEEEETITEEEAIDCSVGMEGEISEPSASCLFRELIDAHEIAHGLKVSQEREVKAVETILKLQGTNIMESMESQSARYMEFAKKVIAERLNLTGEGDFDIENFYIK